MAIEIEDRRVINLTGADRFEARVRKGVDEVEILVHSVSFIRASTGRLRRSVRLQGSLMGHPNSQVTGGYLFLHELPVALADGLTDERPDLVSKDEPEGLMLGEKPGDRAILVGQPEDVMVREPKHDMLDTWAWRSEAPCDETCHHPMHAFGARARGVHHLEWFRPGSESLTPCPSAPATSPSPAVTASLATRATAPARRG